VKLEGRAQQPGRIRGVPGSSVLATWPLARHASDHVYGLGTPPLNVWRSAGYCISFRVTHCTCSMPRLLSVHRQSRLLEHLFVPALLASPVVAATGTSCSHTTAWHS